MREAFYFTEKMFRFNLMNIKFFDLFFSFSYFKHLFKTNKLKRCNLFLQLNFSNLKFNLTEEKTIAKNLQNTILNIHLYIYNLNNVY